MKVEQRAAGQRDVALGSAALSRLIDEVRAGDAPLAVNGYNRTYNRHNR